MADNSILTPGYQDTVESPSVEPEVEQYLQISNYLGEYDSDEKKAVVRGNLGVPSKDSVYTKQDADNKISLKIQEAVQQLLSMEDPYGILPQVAEMISLMVKTDGSTPFTLPQSGVDPQSDSHLTTKKYVDQLLRNHLNTNDPHNILKQVQDLLQWYAKSADVYTKDQVYTINDIARLLSSYIKNDGTTPFRNAQIGVDPELDSHLSTKRYVDKVMQNHKVEIDPHNFLSTLNNRLSAYSKKQDVYDKTQTYSRTQLDSVINNLVSTFVDNRVQDYKDYVNDLITTIYNQNYIKQDGSIPFTNPQKGVKGIASNDLITLEQLIEAINTISIDPPTWITSGPVETTVGFIEDNSEVPTKMTFQEVMDAIFYGKSISINVPENTSIGKTCEVLLCIHGSIGDLELAELYQGEELIATFTKDNFVNGCITVESQVIMEDTEFKFRVVYGNDVEKEITATTKVSMPVFVGLLPKWKSANTITMDYLEELEAQDIEGVQNRFLNEFTNSIKFYYEFEDSALRHPFVVIPEDYADLESMVIQSQSFGLDAFDVVDMIPLSVEGKDVIYKIYVYRQALSSLHQDVTFNFKSE